MDSTQSRIIRYLSDAHAAEGGLEETLADFGANSPDPDLQDLYQGWLTATGDHKRLVEARLSELGSGTSTGKNFLNAMMAKAGDLMNAGHDEGDRRVENLIKAYSAAHFKRGNYNALGHYATSVGDLTTSALALRLEEEAVTMAAQIFPSIALFAVSHEPMMVPAGVA